MLKTPEPSSRWLREPLFHFIVLASVLFLVDYLSTEALKDQVVVSRVTADFLVRQREEMLLRALSPQEKQDTVDRYIDDEILYNEAYKRGLDRADSRMRRSLIRKMRSLLAGEIADPGPEQLRAFYQSHKDRFVSAETWSYDHVFFSNPASVPDELLARLRGNLDPRSIGEDSFNLRNRMKAVTRRDLIIIFGAEKTGSLLAIDDSEWHGPLQSAIGTHFIRLIAHNPPVDPPFESVEPYLEGEWRVVEMQRRLDLELISLREQYAVIIETQDSGS
jgi:hypothetical protein